MVSYALGGRVIATPVDRQSVVDHMLSGSSIRGFGKPVPYVDQGGRDFEPQPNCAYMNYGLIDVLHDGWAASLGAKMRSHVASAGKTSPRKATNAFTVGLPRRLSGQRAVMLKRSIA